MSDVRKTHFPYGMAKNPDGSWTFFNRNYKPVGVDSKQWVDWDVPEHKIRFAKQPTSAALRALDIRGTAEGDRIYFYDDGCVPTQSTTAMKAYLDRMGRIMSYQTKRS